VLLLSVLSPHHSTSEYPINYSFPFDRSTPKCSVSCRFLIIRFTANKCETLGTCMYLLTTPTLKLRYGRVLHRYLRLPTMLLYTVESTPSSSRLCSNFTPISAGVIAELLYSILNFFNRSRAYFVWCMTTPEVVCVNSIPRK